MSLENALPDEVLSEILAPALKVDDATFSSTDEKSPFASYTESPSAYLLVNKAWLRVATPLLYHVVCVRSRAQAKALERALTGNTLLGTFIRKLRVEGGFGASMHNVLKLAPNVSDLHLTLLIPSGDNTDGICKGLALVNPVRFILVDKEYEYNQTKNKATRALYDALVKQAPRWSRLTSFSSPYTRCPGRAPALCEALAAPKRIKTLFAVSVQSANSLYAYFKDCPVEDLIVTPKLTDFEVKFHLPRVTDQKVKSLLRYTTQSQSSAMYKNLPDIAPSLDPFFKPMESAPEDVQDSVWSRILHFALYVPELGEWPPRWDIPKTRVTMLTVSSRFHRIGLERLCEHIYLRSLPYIEALAEQLARRPALKSHIRTLVVAHGPIWIERQDEVATHRRLLSEILLSPPIPHLQRLSSLRDEQTHAIYYNREEAISWDTFAGYATSAGAKHLGVCAMRIAWPEDELQASAGVFNTLVGLRTLHWRCHTRFDMNALDEAVDADALPLLQELIVRESDRSFAAVITCMNLPSLKSIRLLQEINTNLLVVHGTKLTSLEVPISALINLSLSDGILDLCPNLCSLVVSWGYNRIYQAMADLTPPDGPAFSAKTPAVALTSLMFDTGYFIDKPATKTFWGDYLRTTFPHASLPNLKEISTKAFKWPTTEKLIAKSPFVRAAETLIPAGIALKDGDGKAWRMRLGSTARARPAGGAGAKTRAGSGKGKGKGKAADAAPASAADASGSGSGTGRSTRSSARRAGKA
ncbi:F-box domain-containing protein [Mycena kentingensis (nom. inval.)]|nr:F-box domain-containing protein [Mycena kentingensis (nom. inval.)]